MVPSPRTRSANTTEKPTGLDVRQRMTALAARQHGIVTRPQLLAAGMTADGIDRQVKVGHLRLVHRGVYLVGPIEARYSREMAACLACGPSAVVSHRSAACLWQLMTRAGRSTSVDISSRSGKRSRPGIRIRRIGTLTDDEVMDLDGIPITSPSRTLYDLSSCIGPRELERAIAEAFARRLVRPAELEAQCNRFRGRPGSRTLRFVLDGGRPDLTRSEAEERFLALIRKAQLDPPAVNATTSGYEVDFLWRAEGLAVEIDGFAFHSSPIAFESDRRRDAVLAAAGLRVVRVTWRHLLDEPEAVLARLAKALARSG